MEVPGQRGEATSGAGVRREGVGPARLYGASPRLTVRGCRSPVRTRRSYPARCYGTGAIGDVPRGRREAEVS